MERRLQSKKLTVQSEGGQLGAWHLMKEPIVDFDEVQCPLR